MTEAGGDGRHLELVAGGARATVCTRGAALVALRVDDLDVVVPGPPGPCRAEQFRGVVLAPWPNRTEPRYAWDGRALELAVTEPHTGAAIHGLVHDRAWDVASASAAEVVLATRLGDDPGYPFDVALRASYAIEATGIRAEVVARNEGDGPAPVGLGAHPYLGVGDAAVDDVVLDLPAAAVLDLGPRGTPAGPPRAVAGSDLDLRGGRRVGAAVLDHAFVELGQPRAELRAGGRRVVLRAGSTVRCAMVFTSDSLDPPARRAAIAVEPMTCPPGALASGDVDVLEPGEELALRWDVHAGDG